jgi:hypothetical protein
VPVVPVPVSPEVGVDPDGVAVVQVGTVMRSLINVTAPVRARARPVSVTLSPIVTEVCARTVPANTVPVPNVAELPICQ